VQLLPKFLLHLLLHIEQEVAVQIASEYLRVNVALAANRRRVAEPSGNLLDGRLEVFLRGLSVDIR
jgi:hypothetical protein